MSTKILGTTVDTSRWTAFQLDLSSVVWWVSEQNYSQSMTWVSAIEKSQTNEKFKTNERNCLQINYLFSCWFGLTTSSFLPFYATLEGMGLLFSCISLFSDRIPDFWRHLQLPYSSTWMDTNFNLNF